MRQVWIPRTGAPEVLQLREAADPEPGPGQIRVRVAAAGVNFADLLARLGLYPDAPKLPAVVGYEVAGTVDAVGAGVGDVAIGSRVACLTHFGGYSDTVVVPVGFALPIPESLSFQKAAAIPVNYLTAWLMLVHLAGVRAGERVLVHAAAGGIGQAALQICRFRGAEVIGTASAGKHDRLKAAGVAHTIDYTREDFEAAVMRITGGRGVDVALDGLGGSSFRRSYRCLAPLGRLCLYGVSTLAPGAGRNLFAAVRGIVSMGAFWPISLMNRNRTVIGFNLGHLWSEGPLLRGMLEDILRLVVEGVLDPVVDRGFPLEQAAAAHAYIHDRKNFGKVLLLP